MPNSKFHRKIGFFTALCIGILLYYFFYNQIKLEGLDLILIPITILFYSNMPDLDHHMSKIRKSTLKFVFTAMVLSCIIFYFVNIQIMLAILAVCGLLGLFIISIPHRGPLHTYWFALVAALPMLYFNWFLFVIAFVCSGSHILVDRFISAWKRRFIKIGLTS
jgi:hypothetical protein